MYRARHPCSLYPSTNLLRLKLSLARHKKKDRSRAVIGHLFTVYIRSKRGHFTSQTGKISIHSCGIFVNVMGTTPSHQVKQQHIRQLRHSVQQPKKSFYPERFFFDDIAKSVLPLQAQLYIVTREGLDSCVVRLQLRTREFPSPGARRQWERHWRNDLRTSVPFLAIGNRSPWLKFRRRRRRRRRWW